MLVTSLDEWKNFLERIGVDPDNEEEVNGCMDDIRIWASYRGQTLARTGNMNVLSSSKLPKLCLLCLSYSFYHIMSSERNDVL